MRGNRCLDTMAIIRTLQFENLSSHQCCPMYYDCFGAHHDVVYSLLRMIPYQLLGFLVVFFALFLFLLGLVAPNAYNGLVLIDEKQMIHALDEMNAEDKKKVDGDDNEIEEGALDANDPSDANDEADIDVSGEGEDTGTGEVVAA